MTSSTITKVPGASNVDGWVSASEAWTYAAADAPTFTFTVPADVTSKYSPGMRIKLTQTTVKYFIITAVAYSAGLTTITVYGGTDYTLANAAISANYYSMVKAPLGFPQNPIKWTVKVTDTSDYTQVPGLGTWYNKGSISISIPIGCWNVDYQICLQLEKSGGASLGGKSSLSTSTVSETDAEFSAALYCASPSSVNASLRAEKQLLLAAKTSYYLIEQVWINGADNLVVVGSRVPTVIRAICAYL